MKNELFEIGKIYAVYGTPEKERKIVTTARVKEVKATGKVQFEMVNNTDLQMIFPSKRKDGYVSKSLKVMNCQKDRKEFQFTQVYSRKTDKWLSIYSYDIQ